MRHVGKVRNSEVGTYRRALSAEEVGRLLKVAPASRGWVYLVILYTGLRRHELNRLNWGHFHLDIKDPVVELPANVTKNRKPDLQPLRPEVVNVLKVHKPSNAVASELVFRGKVPSPDKLREDLIAAGIPAVDERGRRVDVHALRKTFCVLMRVAGVPIDHAKELMRHSDIRLTLDVYGDVAQLPLAGDVAKLPAFSLAKLAAGVVTAS